MNPVRRLTVVLQITMAFIVLSVPALADSPAPPRDYKKVTENNEYVFVMLAPEGLGKSQGSTIREVYKQSGLYRNDGSTTPLWVVYWYAFEVYPSSDGKHLVRMGPWASSVEQLALSFYRNGEEIRSYRIRDLVRDETKLSRTVSHFFWRSELRYDDKKGSVFLKTKDNQAYWFSVNTGEITQETKGEQTPAKP
jgi:hypothetical protein